MDALEKWTKYSNSVDMVILYCMVDTLWFNSISSLV